jgi:hypothetical protein
MPSLRAELNATQRERATQLAFASCDTSWVSSRPVPPGKRVADSCRTGRFRAACRSAARAGGAEELGRLTRPDG